MWRWICESLRCHCSLSFFCLWCCKLTQLSLLKYVLNYDLWEPRLYWNLLPEDYLMLFFWGGGVVRTALGWSGGLSLNCRCVQPYLYRPFNGTDKSYNIICSFEHFTVFWDLIKRCWELWEVIAIWSVSTCSSWRSIYISKQNKKCVLKQFKGPLQRTSACRSCLLTEELCEKNETKFKKGFSRGQELGKTSSVVYYLL